MSEVDEKVRIRVYRSDHRALMRQGSLEDDMADVVHRLVQLNPDEDHTAMPIKNSLYRYAESLLKVSGMADAMTPLNISDRWGSIGVKTTTALMGVSRERFLDFGIRDTQKARIITFMKTDNPYELSTSLVIGVLEAIMEQFGEYQVINEIEEHRNALAEIFVRGMKDMLEASEIQGGK